MHRVNRTFMIKPSEFPNLSNPKLGIAKIQKISFAKTAAPKEWLKDDEIYIDTIGNGVSDGWVRIPFGRGKDRYFDFGKPSAQRISFEKNTSDFNARLKKKCDEMEYNIMLDSHTNAVKTDIYLNGIESIHYNSVGMDEQNIINNITNEIVYSSDSDESIVTEENMMFVDDKHL